MHHLGILAHCQLCCPKGRCGRGFVLHVGTVVLPNEVSGGLVLNAPEGTDSRAGTARQEAARKAYVLVGEAARLGGCLFRMLTGVTSSTWARDDPVATSQALTTSPAASSRPDDNGSTQSNPPWQANAYGRLLPSRR